MTTTEIVLNMLAETSTTDISKVEKPVGLAENIQVAQQGGEIAGIARKALEERTRQPVITAKNAANFKQLVIEIMEDAAALPDADTPELNESL